MYQVKSLAAEAFHALTRRYFGYVVVATVSYAWNLKAFTKQSKDR